MNIHSLFKIMARAIDETKIEKIKQAAIKLIVEEGYGGASVSKIAKQAKVAEGYLYRDYASKKELINDILNNSIISIVSQIEQILTENTDLKIIIEKIIRIIFKYSIEDSMRMKFIYVLMNDYNFTIDKELQNRTLAVCEKFIKIGTSNNQIISSLTVEDVYLQTISYSIQFINHRMKNYFGISALDENAIQKVLSVNLKAILK